LVSYGKYDFRSGWKWWIECYVGLSGINCANFDHGRVKRWRRLVRQHRLLRRCHRWNYEADNCQIYSRSHCCRPAQGCLDTPSFYNGTDRASMRTARPTAPDPGHHLIAMAILRLPGELADAK
jgi:hypothetical protein